MAKQYINHGNQYFKAKDGRYSGIVVCPVSVNKDVCQCEVMRGSFPVVKAGDMISIEREDLIPLTRGDYEQNKLLVPPIIHDTSVLVA